MQRKAILLVSLSLLTIICSYGVVSAAAPDLVLIVARHGARAPIDTIYDTTWGDQYEQLTKTGARQHYLLGAALRANYSGGALKNYTPSSVYLRAHSQNRTLQSIYAQALGLFPPGTGPILSNGTDALDNLLQPVPVHSINTTQEYLLDSVSPTVCPIQPYLQRNEADPEAQEIIQMIQPTFTKFSEVYGRNVSLNELSYIFDTLICDWTQNKTFPANLSFIEYDNDYWKNMSFAHDWWDMYSDFSTFQQRGLYSVNILNEITARFNNYLTQKAGTAPTFLSYLGHDTTLDPILALFNITTHDCIKSNYLNGSNTNPACHIPYFASSLKFELYKVTNANDSYLRFYYDDAEINLCPNGTTPCTVQLFNQTVTNLTNGTDLQGYYQQCYYMQAERVDEGKGLKMALWILLGVNGLLILGFIFACIYKKKLQTSSVYDDYYSSTPSPTQKNLNP